MSTARLTIDRRRRRAAVRPIADGRWPLLPLADWKAGKVPFVVRERVEGRTAIRVEGPTGRTAIEVGK
jgi:hypothetical protein